MNWLTLLQLIPEFVKLIKAISKEVDKHSELPGNIRKDMVKIKVQEVREAFEERDEKKLNSAFNTL